MNKLNLGRRLGFIIHTVTNVTVGTGHIAWKLQMYSSGDYTRFTDPLIYLRTFIPMWLIVLGVHLLFPRRFVRAETVENQYKRPFTVRHILRDVHVGLFFGINAFLWSASVSEAVTWGGSLFYVAAVTALFFVTGFWGLVLIMHSMVVHGLDQQARAQV